MEVVEILGFAGALLIGIVLGLIGGGGSILTVPVLVYLLQINPVTATAYSLFIVGISSFVGSVKNIKKRQVDFKTAFIFSGPALIVVYLTRKFLIPNLPEELFQIYGFLVTRDIAIMIFFAVVMVLASLSMIRGKCMNCDDEEVEIEYNIPMLLLQAIVVGIISGFVGAGGGFLIIPALVVLVKLPMKRAVATSLLIIAVNSLIGFLGDLQTTQIDWSFLIAFSMFSIVGILLGIYLNKYITGSKLKRSFGWFVLIMGIYVLINELNR